MCITIIAQKYFTCLQSRTPPSFVRSSVFGVRREPDAFLGRGYDGSTQLRRLEVHEQT